MVRFSIILPALLLCTTVAGAGFLIVWTDMRTSSYNFQGLDQNGRDVYAARLDASGNMIDTTPIIVHPLVPGTELRSCEA